MRRCCKEIKENGQACQQAPLTGKDLCYWHDPETAEQAAEARRMGGLRRRREMAVASAYDIDSLDSLEDLKRVLHIAIVDTLALENSITRNRALGQLVQIGYNLFERTDTAGQLQTLEDAVRPRLLHDDEGKRSWWRRAA